MKKYSKKVFIGSIIIILILLINGNFIFEKTETVIVDVDKVFLNNNYVKMDEYEIFSKDYDKSIDDQNDILGITFDLENNFLYIKLEERMNGQWIEYAMIGYSYFDNMYSISYYRKNDKDYLRRLYLYYPNENDNIELVVSDFDGDFYAESDLDKKLYFEITKEILDEELYKIDLSIEDLIIWNENR
jgi:hypothetical protein